MSTLLRTRGGQVAYEIYGTGGTPVVAVPGIGDTRASYRALGPILADAGYTLYAMDLRGHGESSADFDSYTPEDIGDDVVDLLEALDLRDAVLIGNSIGGASIAHASLQTDRVARLVLLNGFVRDMPADRWMRPLVPVLFASPWGVAVWGMYRKTLFVSEPADHQANRAEVLENLREPGRLHAVRSMMRASKASIGARLSEVSVPALIVMGAQDPDYSDPAEEGRIQAEQLGGQNHVVVVDRSGHYPQIERPDATARAILDFLAQEARLGA